MKIKKLFIIILISVIAIRCSDMNDKHNVYMEKGEIIYLGKVDSAKVFGGHNRFLLRYWISDMRVKELKVYWNQKADSLIIPVQNHKPTDSLEIIIGSKKNMISEGNHVLQLFCTDGRNVRSIATERAVNVYGDKYIMTLSNRVLSESSFNYLNSEVTLGWYPPYSEKEIGIEISYRSMLNGDEVIVVPTKDVGNQTKLSTVDISYPIFYRTLYLPEPLAIDTFYTVRQEIIVE